MAWTAPRTWVAYEVVSAAIMNVHVRDNLLARKDVDDTHAAATAAAGHASVGAHDHETDANGGLLGPDVFSGGANFVDDVDIDGSMTISENIGMSGDPVSEIYHADNDKKIVLRGGASACGAIYLCGKDNAYDGAVMLFVPDSGGLWQDATLVITGMSDTPQVWCRYDCSALSFTDRTPWFVGDALAAIAAIRGGAEGIDKDSLPPGLKRLCVVRGKDGSKRTEVGRDLSATVSALTSAVQQILKRVEGLERG